MVSTYILDEIMKLPSDNSTMLMQSLHLLKSFKIELITNEKFDILYRVKVDDITNSDLENDTLLEIRNGGWEYDSNKEYIVKKIEK